jgi:hypothetical protein
MISSVLLSVLLLSGCGSETKEISCKEKGADFFKVSLQSYFKKQGKSQDADDFKLLDGARYNEKLNWWVVPFDLRGKRLDALLSCDGNLELTIPPQ